MENYKVTKKDERLARALGIYHLMNICFPIDEIQEKINETWPSYLKDAREINKLINVIEDWELDLYIPEFQRHWLDDKE